MQNMCRHLVRGAVLSLLVLFGIIIFIPTKTVYAAAPVPTNGITQKAVSLQVGKTESEVNVTWYADTDKAGELQIAPKAGLTNEFPAAFQTVQAAVNVANDKGFYSNQATATGLLSNKTYLYRVVNDGKTSPVYSFVTGKSGSDFNFLLTGDPQIGASKNIPKDSEEWKKTLLSSVAQSKPEFILSVGDQVNTASNEIQYTGFLDNDTIKSVPMATTIGNHDTSSAAYTQHFMLPNVSATHGVTKAGGNYWYVYNNALFMVINSNNQTTAEHKAFIEEAIALNPNVKWKTVVFHHSIYSTASHVADSDIIKRRSELPSVFKELGIDIVLAGHDHVYTRTYMMDGATPQITSGVESSANSSDGILYLTANSASGSKYYNLNTTFDTSFAAVKEQSKRKTVTDVQITDMSYRMITYYVEDKQVIDDFTVYKAAQNANRTALHEAVLKGEKLSQGNFELSVWNTFKNSLDQADKVLNNSGATQAEIDQAFQELDIATKGLEKKPGNKEKLQKAVSEAEKFIQNDYLADTWTAFAAALEEAKKVLGDQNAEQTIIDDAWSKLQKTQSELVKRINKTALQKKVDQLKKLKESDYTTESWSALSAALTEAEAVLVDQAADQEMVDACVVHLENAVASLELEAADQETVDKSKLQKMVIQYILLEETEYTPESWADFKLVLDQAEDLINDAEATQEIVDQTLHDLEEAYKALIAIALSPAESVDMGKLQQKINECIQLQEKEYTQESWKVLKMALVQARAVIEDAEATQEMIDQALLELENAGKDLQAVTPTAFAVDKIKLQEVIDQCTQLSSEKYIKETWDIFYAALKNAKAVMDDPDATQTNIDEALANLEYAKSNLKVIGKPEQMTVNKSKLQSEIQAAAALKQNDYTEESWKNFAEALQAAREVEGNENSSQADVDRGVERLLKAKDELKTKANTPVKKNGENSKKNNTAEKTSNTKKAVQTGDTTKPLLLVVLMLLSVGGLIIAWKKIKGTK